jgi:hypothetical protein
MAGLGHPRRAGLTGKGRIQWIRAMSGTGALAQWPEMAPSSNPGCQVGDLREVVSEVSLARHLRPCELGRDASARLIV